jgi:hypothetical protein
MLISWASKETVEFQRQSYDTAAQCKTAKILAETLLYPGYNHFSLPQEFKNAKSDLVQGVLKLCS